LVRSPDPKNGKKWVTTGGPEFSDRAGIGDLTFHDIRGRAVVRLAVAGATGAAIATFTGQSLKDVEAILDAHYLGRDV
jgi:hypothetical protein